MGVHLIIDGYNLIRASASMSRQEADGLAYGREALISRLAAYKRIKHWPVTVVFDAMAGPSLSESREQVAGIKVVYSPADQTADQVIVRMARKKGQQAMVVTSDRELAGLAEAAGATVLDSPAFEARMEMAFYMETKGGGVEAEDREPTLSTVKKGPRRRRSKAERQREARLRKV